MVTKRAPLAPSGWPIAIAPAYVRRVIWNAWAPQYGECLRGEYFIQFDYIPFGKYEVSQALTPFVLPKLVQAYDSRLSSEADRQRGSVREPP